MYLLMCASSVATTAALVLWWYFHVPSTIPPSIPRIPIYVNLLAMWYNTSQIDLYNQWYRAPLEKHGAIVIWFTGCWCILVTQPDYLVDLFRNEETYPKVGVNVRGLGSLMGLFTGENIINSRKPNWNTFTSIMKPGFLKTFDHGAIHEKAKKVPERFLRAQAEIGGVHRGIDPFQWVERYAQDVMSLCLFDFDLQALDEPRVPYRPLLGQILPAIFTRWSLYFPKLDILGRNLLSRGKTLQNIAAFDNILDGIVDSTMSHDAEKKEQQPKEQPKVVSHLLKEALDSGRISYAQYRSNLRMTFMFGHDTTAFFLMSIMWELGRNQPAQEILRAEALHPTSTPSTIHSLPYLSAFLYETLRLYPPVTEMLNHSPSHPALLGGKVPVQPGTWIGWNAYGAHTNPAVWGSDASEFRPERWGATVQEVQANMRLQSIKGNFIPFSLHARKCLGQGLVLTEVKLVLFELVRRVKWRVDPAYVLQMSGVMFSRPVGLRIIVEELEG
ncbi:cytochrome P450 [Aspergillus varians]